VALSTLSQGRATAVTPHIPHFTNGYVQTICRIDIQNKSLQNDEDEDGISDEDFSRPLLFKSTK
jgi:hypothetical protein